MPDNNTTEPSDAELLSAVEQVLTILLKVSPEGRKRVVDTIITFFKLSYPALRYSSSADNPQTTFTPSYGSSSENPQPHLPSNITFSEDRSIPPKQFLHEKSPQTDVERVACLAFYLTHYRGMPHFKTLDISKLNTEAAQIKFSNAAVAVNNASLQNYLTGAGRGTKQISAFGEKFVMALPDREAAKQVMSQARARRRIRKTNQQRPPSTADE